MDGVLRRFAPIALLCTVVLVAMLVVGLSSERLSAALRPKIVAALSERMGLPVHIGYLELYALPPKLVAGDVSVGTPTSDEAVRTPLWVTLRKVRLRPHWSSALLGRLVLAEASVEGVSVEARLPAGTQHAAGPRASIDPTAWHLPLDVHALSVSDAQATLWRADGMAQLRGVHVSCEAQRWRLRQLSLHVDDAQWRTLDGDEVALSLHVDGQVHGSLRHIRRVTLDRAQLDGAGQRVDVFGDLDCQSPNGALHLDGQGNLDGPALQALPGWPALPPVAGSISGALRGDWRQPHARVQLLLHTLAPAPLARAELHVAARLDGHSLQISSGHIDVAGQPICTGSGSLQWAGPRAWLWQARLHRADVPQLLGALGLADPARFALLLDGSLQLEGTLLPHWQLRASADWRGSDAELFSTHGVKAHDRGHRIVGLLPFSLQGSAVANAQGIEVPKAVLRCADGELQMEGNYRLVGRPARLRAPLLQAEAQRGAQGVGLHARLHATGFPLQALSPIAGIPYSGSMVVDGTAEGRGAGLLLRSTVQVDDLAIGGIHIGASEGLLSFAAGRLALAKFVNTRGDGRLLGEGFIDFDVPQAELSAALSLERVELSALLRDLGIQGGWTQQVQAALWGQLHLHGPLSRPQGHASLQAPRLALAEVDLGASELSINLAEGRQLLSGTLWTHPQRGTLTASASWGDGRRLGLTARAQDLPLTVLHPGAHGGGLLSLRLQLEGALDALGGSFVGDVAMAPGAGTGGGTGNGELGRGGLHVVARAEDGVAHLDINLLQGTAQAKGTLQLRDDWRLALEGQFRALEGQAIWEWLPGLERYTQGSSLTASGRMALSGPLAAPAAWRMRLALDTFAGKWRGTQLTLEKPIVLALAQGRLRLPKAVFLGPLLRLGVEGSLPVTDAPGAAGSQRLDLQLNLQGDLAAVRPFVPQLASARGALHVAVALQGSYQRPLLLGEAELQNGALRLATGEYALEHVALKAIFSGRGLALTVGHATLGRGQVRAQGEMSVGEGSWLSPAGTMSLRLGLTHVPLSPYPDLIASFTGNLELSGAWQALALHGDLRVQALRYTARLDLNRLVPKRRAPPLKAPWLPLNKPVSLNVKLRAPNDLIVSSKVLEAELAANLLVTGSTERIGLLGSVTPLWARASYRDNVFTVTHATIDFTDEYRISPVYSVEGRTRACQMDATMLVQGDVDGYTLTPQGRDEHGVVDPQDVLSCLSLGVRLSDFTGNRGQASGLGDARYSGLEALWTVTGLDDKVRKLLPVRVDELRLTSGWSSLMQRTTARVLVGRELGKKLTVRFSRSLEDADQAVSLDYAIDGRTTLQGNWLTALDIPVGNFGVDLRLHWELP